MAGLLDKAIDDMQNGLGSRLMDLAHVVAAVAEAQNDSFLHVLPNAIGGFASELISARALVAIPMLPDPVRKRLSSQITVAVSEATSSLNSIKQELCSREAMDHKTVMDAVGKLFEQATILAKEQRVVIPRRGRGPPGPSDMD